MLRKFRKKLQLRSQKAIGLVEIMITILISIIAFISLLRLFIYWICLGKIAGGLTIAACEAQGKLEEIRNYSFHNFNKIVSDYGPAGNPGNIFNLTQENGAGVIYLNDSNPELLEIEIDVSLESWDGRIIGDDKNLNGIKDPGEDMDGDGKLNSPISLASLIAKR